MNTFCRVVFSLLERGEGTQTPAVCAILCKRLAVLTGGFRGGRITS
jgi:hypothetical protein